MGRVILNASETRDRYDTFQMCFVMFLQMFFFFFLLCTSISCNWSDSHRHLCCLDTQYVMDARKLCVSPPLSICICTFPHKDFSSSHFSFFFYLFFEEESLNFTNIPCYLYSALNHLTAVKFKKKKNSDGTTSL